MSRLVRALFGGRSKEDKAAAAAQAEALQAQRLATQDQANRTAQAAADSEASRLRSRRAGRLRLLAFNDEAGAGALATRLGV